MFHRRDISLKQSITLLAVYVPAWDSSILEPYNELRTETRIVKIIFAGLRKSHFQDFFTEEALNHPINVKS